MTTPLDQTRNRIENAAVQNYAPYAIAKRHPRRFRYSDRRLYRATKWNVVSAIAGKPVYCPFLGHGGVTLAAATKDTVPVLTYIRYPVSYRRRMRFIKDFALSQGVLETYTDDKGVVHPEGEGATVYYGDPAAAREYIKFVSDKDSCVVAAYNGDPTAIYCCNVNGWGYTEDDLPKEEESDSESGSESESKPQE